MNVFHLFFVKCLQNALLYEARHLLQAHGTSPDIETNLRLKVGIMASTIVLSTPTVSVNTWGHLVSTAAETFSTKEHAHRMYFFPI